MINNEVLKVSNPYRQRLFPHSLSDFSINADDNRAYIVSNHALVNLNRGTREIGSQWGRVFEMATGVQFIEGSELPVEMRLYGTGDTTNHLQNVAQHITLSTNTDLFKDRSRVPIGIDSLCPGSFLGLDCGCRSHTHRMISGLFGTGGNGGLYVCTDPFIRSQEKREIVQSLIEAHGVSQSDLIAVNPGVNTECVTKSAIRDQYSCTPRLLEGTRDKAYFLTAAVSVTFQGGKPANLFMIEEFEREDKVGIAGKGKKHYIFVYGDIHNQALPPVVRYHSSCITAELHGNGCDCRVQLEKTLGYCVENGSGIIILAEEEGMGSGLINKLWQTQLTANSNIDLLSARDDHLDIPADIRDYSLIRAVKQLLSLEQIQLASNNLIKREAFDQAGISVVGTYPMTIDVRDFAKVAEKDFEAKCRSRRYLKYT